MISLIITTSISLWIGTFFMFGLPLFTPIDSLYLRLIGLTIFLVGPLGFFLWGLRQKFISKAKKARLIGGYLLINGFALYMNATFIYIIVMSLIEPRLFEINKY